MGSIALNSASRAARAHAGAPARSAGEGIESASRASRCRRETGRGRASEGSDARVGAAMTGRSATFSVHFMVRPPHRFARKPRDPGARGTAEWPAVARVFATLIARANARNDIPDVFPARVETGGVVGARARGTARRQTARLSERQPKSRRALPPTGAEPETHAPLNLMRPLPALQWTATAVFLRPEVWTWMATGRGSSTSVARSCGSGKHPRGSRFLRARDRRRGRTGRASALRRAKRARGPAESETHRVGGHLIGVRRAVRAQARF